MRGGHQILPRDSAAVLWPRSTISILGMKRMFSQMDRSPTLEDRNTKVRFWSQTDMCGATGHVRFTPNSDRESDFRKRSCPLYARKRTYAVQHAMSALGQKRTFGAYRLPSNAEPHGGENQQTANDVVNSRALTQKQN